MKLLQRLLPAFKSSDLSARKYVSRVFDTKPPIDNLAQLHNKDAKKIKVGIVGYGGSVKNFHLPCLAQCPEYELKAVVTRNQGEAVKDEHPEVIVFNSLENMLKNDDVDLVIVASPNHLHYEHTKAALEANKHVVVEKPFSIEPEHGEELAKLAEARKLKLSVFHNRRWDKSFLELLAAMHDEEIRNLDRLDLTWNRNRPEVKNRWKENSQLGGGSLYDLGAHMLDQAFLLLGNEYDNQETELKRERKGSKSTDAFDIKLDYPGTKVNISSSSLKEPSEVAYLKANTGELEIQEQDPQEDELQKGQSPTTYQIFYRQMANAILNSEMQVPVSPEEANDVIKFIHSQELD